MASSDASLAGVGRERTRERPLAGELAGEQRDARRFVEMLIVRFDGRDPQQFETTRA